MTPLGPESILAAGVVIEGTIEGSCNVRLVGRFKGSARVDGMLTIEAGASVEGEVNAEIVRVAGEMVGPIVAKDRVEFTESGTLLGDLTAPSLTVAPGAKLTGRVRCGPGEGRPQESGVEAGRLTGVRPAV